MNELLRSPRALVGLLLPLVRPQVRLRVAAAASVGSAPLATILSGEYEMGWEFLLIDIPLVASAPRRRT